MSKYYLDTEFLEGTQKEKFPISLFRKTTPPTIDLISIGIVAEDGREYYAISKDFNLKEAWNRFDLKTVRGDKFFETEKVYWIRENVLKPIFIELCTRSEEDGFIYNRWHIFKKGFSFKSLKTLINHYGKTNKDIAEEIISFTEPVDRFYSLDGDKRFTHGSIAVGNFESEDILSKSLKFHYPASKPEFYAYFADYDWVVFCWIFGKMMDLPKGFPMYCNDLKQVFEQKQDWLRLPTAKNHIDLKAHSHYPKQENEHSAIHDARWNKKLHEFLNTI